MLFLNEARQNVLTGFCISETRVQTPNSGLQFAPTQNQRNLIELSGRNEGDECQS